MSANIGESRSELLHWINSLLDLNYSKVEQCGTGAVYCQIIDSIYGNVPMNKVNFNAKFDYEYVHNYKVLQSAFAKLGINKVVPVDRLIKCKLQDNLEFLQWLKKFWAENKDESEYNANSRRKPIARGGNATSGGSASSRSGSSLNNTRTTPSASRTTNRTAQLTRSATTGTTKPRVTSSTLHNGAGNGSTVKNSYNGASSSNSVGRVFGQSSVLNAARTRVGPSAQTAKLQKELQETQADLSAVTDELSEFKIAAEGLETERNFYFKKLRDIEILSQAITDQLSEEAEKQHQQHLNGEAASADVLTSNQSLIEFVEKIQDILYSTEEGFQVPDQDVEEGDGLGDEYIHDASQLENDENLPQPIDEEGF